MKRILLLTVCIIATLSSFAQSGTTGPLTWSISDSTLTISGTGAMPDYYATGTPWYDYRQTIKNVVISDGVTSIGNSAFFGFRSLTSVSIPNSVTRLEGGAFSDCSALTQITIPNSVTSIGANAFHSCFAFHYYSQWCDKH